MGTVCLASVYVCLAGIYVCLAGIYVSRVPSRCLCVLLLLGYDGFFPLHCLHRQSCPAFLLGDQRVSEIIYWPALTDHPDESQHSRCSRSLEVPDHVLDRRDALPLFLYIRRLVSG